MFSYDKKTKKLEISILGLRIRSSFNFEKTLIKLLKPFFHLLDIIIPKNNKKIIFYSFPNFTDNTYAYYKYLLKNHSRDYKFVWITLDSSNNDFVNSKTYDLYTFKAIFNMLTAKYIVSTHANVFISFFKSSKHIYLNLWHGMPIKTLGYCEKVRTKKRLLKNYDFLAKHSYMFATSDLFKNLFIPCFKIDYNKVFITGHAKNDLIFSTENDVKIKEWFDIEKYNKVIFYLPTYKSKTGERKTQIDKEFSNIFYMDDFEHQKFLDYLEKENILFILKPHPMEEKLYKQKIAELSNSDRFKVVYNEDLEEKKISLYEIFKFVDLMISDFSSVAVDYLVLNRPVVYLNNYDEEYKTNRGVVLEDNYTVFMPGSKVNNFNELLIAVDNNIKNDISKDLRIHNMPFIHKYMDGNSCGRIYEIMKGL